MSSKEELSFRSNSNIYELNDNSGELPIKIDTYAKSVNHYRFKIENLFQEIKMILIDILEVPKSGPEGQRMTSSPGSRNMLSWDNLSRQGMSDMDFTSNSYRYYFKDIGKLIHFKGAEQIDRCIKFINDCSDISIMLPELSFDSHCNEMFFKTYGSLFRSSEFSTEIARSSIQVHFPSDCYSYTCFSSIHRGHLKTLLIYLILSQLVETDEQGKVVTPDLECKTTGRVTPGAIVNFLDKSFCTIFIAFSDSPSSPFQFAASKFQGAIHIVLTTKPLEDINLVGLDEGLPDHGKRSRDNRSLAHEVKVNKSAVYSSRQCRFATTSINKLFVKIDIDGDSLVSIEDLTEFGKRNGLLVSPDVPYT